MDIVLFFKISIYNVYGNLMHFLTNVPICDKCEGVNE